MADGADRATLRCACGWETSGTLEEVIAATRSHGLELHNMEPSREEILTMIAAAPHGDEGVRRRRSSG